MKSTLSKWSVAIAMMVSVTGVSYFAGFRINVTRSQPLGLYRLVDRPPQAGDLVSFSLAEEHPYTRLMRERNSLAGHKTRPYLKRLAALPGDRIHVSKSCISINGLPLPNTRAKKADRLGRYLPALLISGEVPPGKALVLSTYSENSFDGRYLGLLDLDRLHAVEAIYTFN